MRALSDDGRLLALYLLTSHHNTIAGVFRLPNGYATDDMQWETDRVQGAFDELSEAGFAKRCPVTGWVWILNHFKWNRPENPNQKKAARKIVAGVPDDVCWKTDFIRSCTEYIGLSPVNPSETVTETVRETVSPTVPKPFCNQKQKQEQEQDPEFISSSLRAEEKPPRKRVALVSKPPDVSEEVWRDFELHRKNKRSTITNTVMKAARAEATKAGLTFEEFLKAWCLSGYQGYRAEWLQGRGAQASGWERREQERQRVMAGLYGKSLEKSSRTIIDVAAEVVADPSAEEG
jgi:hypothetical protein